MMVGCPARYLVVSNNRKRLISSHTILVFVLIWILYYGYWERYICIDTGRFNGINTAIDILAFELAFVFLLILGLKWH